MAKNDMKQTSEGIVPTDTDEQGRVDRSEGDVNISDARGAWQARHLSGPARTLLERDTDAYLRQSLSSPCLNALKGCDGSFIEDIDGRRYLDFHGNSVHQVGYGHPRVIAAIKKQLDELPFCPRRYTNLPAVQLAERLGAISPEGRLTKVLLAPGGAEAMGIAMKIARMKTGRHKTISFWGAFHGATLDAISIGGEDIFREGAGPLMPGCLHVHPPVARRCEYGCGGVCANKCAIAIEELLEREGDIGAVIAEPVRCTTVEMAPSGYWQRIRAACDAHGALLIFDEIPICLGRTGKMLACEHEGVTPDMLVLGKGLGGGVFPLAAVLAKPELDCHPRGALGHYTHEKSPVGAAAALATLDVIAEERLVERSAEMGERFMGKLRALALEQPLIGEVRGRGLLVGVQMVATATCPDPVASAELAMYACMSRGMSFKVSGGTVLTLTPPLTIEVEHLDRAVDILAAALEEVDRAGR